MAGLRNQVIQDPLAWPWPGGSWRAVALRPRQVAAERRSATAWRVAFVAIEAVVLVVALSVAVQLGSVGLTGAHPGTAPASAPSIERPVIDGQAPALPAPLYAPAPAPGR